MKNIEKKKFEHPIYCSSTLSNNACIYELKKLIESKEIYCDFPYNKQLFYVSYIRGGKSEDVKDIKEVQDHYQNRENLQQVLSYKYSKLTYQSKNYNQYYQQMTKDKTQWKKIILDYYITDNEKQINLSNLPVIRREEIYEHIKQSKNTKNSDPSEQSQTEESDNIQKNNDIEVLDGIYYFIDFLGKNKYKDMRADEQEQCKLMEEYVEKIFDQFNKSVIYSFLSYFVSSCLQKMIGKDIFIDMDIRNFILIRDGSNIKFAYLITFEDFKIDLEQEFQKQKEKFIYEQFCSLYYHFDSISLQDACKEARNKKKPFNKRFQNKYQMFLMQIADSLLNESDRKEAINDSQFAKDCLEGNHNIEDALKSQDLRKRYCKILIIKNQLLTALQNEEALKIFKILYKQEQYQIKISQAESQFSRDSRSNEEIVYITQSEILNSFLQDCLKKANGIQELKSSSQPEKEKETIIEYICEEYPKQQNGQIILSSQQITNRDKSSTLSILSANPHDHEIKALSQQKREMQIQLKIKESKFPTAQESILKKQMEELKQKGNNPSVLEELRKVELQYNNIQNQAPIRGGEKKIIIDFKEKSCSISIKLYFQSELFVLYENVDEMLYCIQILNTSFNDISIYMDDNKRIYFETYFSIGQPDKALLSLIYMIDSIITYALTFFDFYYQNMQNSKSSRDINKYVQLQQEIQQYMQSYKYKFDDFVKMMEKNQ